jgi:hypothetical protein
MWVMWVQRSIRARYATVIAIFCVALCGSERLGEAASFSVRATKDNLDLSFAEDVEFTAESSHAFYGQGSEGTGFYFLIDRGRRAVETGDFDRAKREATRVIASLSSGARFAIIFVGGRVLRFPSQGAPAAATSGSKATAEAWLGSVSGACGPTLSVGVRELIAFAKRSETRSRVVAGVVDRGLETGDIDGHVRQLHVALARSSTRFSLFVVGSAIREANRDRGPDGVCRRASRVWTALSASAPPSTALSSTAQRPGPRGPAGGATGPDEIFHSLIPFVAARVAPESAAARGCPKVDSSR